jgi:hypothetical protein
MALAIDQTSLGTNSGGAGTTIALTTTAAVAAGGRIVVFVMGSVSVSGITDSNGNTYAQDRAHTNGNTISMWSAHSTSTLASSSTITVTYSSSSNPRMVSASSFLDVPSSSAVDQVNSRSSFNSTTWNTSSVTPSEAPSVVVGLSWSGGAATTTSTPDGGWTELINFSNGTNNLTAVYQIVADTTARNPSGTWDAGQSGADQAHVTVNYKEDAGGGGAPAPKIRVVQSTLRW